MYETFAKKAEEEGLKSIAAKFRMAVKIGKPMKNNSVPEMQKFLKRQMKM